jgi:uncharacterized phage-associated protein
MISPFTGGEVSLLTEPRSFEFRGSKFDIIHHCYRCKDTGETFTDTRLDELNLNQVYNQYREKEGIPFQDEISAYRKQYDIPATKFSQILGFGVNMYGKYEAGEMPNVSNGRMINICKDPAIFKNYFLQSIAHRLSEHEKDSFLKKIDKAIEFKQAQVTAEMNKLMALGQTERGIYTGFVAPNLKKTRQMVVFFAQQCSPFVTKMNKLLFYSDFLHFRQTGFAISGISYQAITRGPVPQRFDGLYYNVSDLVDFEEVFYDQNIGGDQVTTIHSFDASLFTEEELMSMQKVLERFKTTPTKSIVDISHDEDAWIDNHEHRNLIPYSYAFQLKAL